MELKNIKNALPTMDDLKKVVLHIQQDCAEKVEEMQVMADEEFKQERLREILRGYAKVDEEYKLKEERICRDTLVYESKMKYESRLRILQEKYRHVEDVLEKARVRLGSKDLPQNALQYRAILKALMIQGLCKLVEPKVTVYCRKQDSAVVRGLLAECRAAYKVVSLLRVELTMCDGLYLSSDSEGGLLLATDLVSLDNTIASRLGTVGFYLLPEMARQLVGGSVGAAEEEAGSLSNLRPSYLPELAVLEQNFKTSLLSVTSAPLLQDRQPEN